MASSTAWDGGVAGPPTLSSFSSMTPSACRYEKRNMTGGREGRMTRIMKRSNQSKKHTNSDKTKTDRDIEKK